MEEEQVEIEKPQNEKIKEIEIDLFLSETGFYRYTTEKINGFLRQYIFEKDSVNPIRITIRLARFPELILFKKDIISYIEEYLPRFQPQDEEGVNLTFDTVALPLNNQLIIELEGAPEQKIKIILRYE